MNPLEKYFVKYPEALGLKSLGFDEPCFGYYNTMGFNRYFDNIKNSDNLIESENIKGNWCTAPTFSQAFRWFRDTYNIDAWVQPFVAQNSRGKLYLPDESYSYLIFRDGVFVCDGADFLEPEDAELACLKKLIEIVKTKQ